MEVTGNMVKAKVAKFHNIDIENVVMNTLYWRILVEDHAALVWYGIEGNAYELPFAAVAVDEDVYINETCEIKETSDIADSGDVWVRLSDGKTCSGEKLQAVLNTMKVVAELNKNNKMCWLDQCELARKYGMVPYADHTADRIFYNKHFVVCYNTSERVYHKVNK